METNQDKGVKDIEESTTEAKEEEREETERTEETKEETQKLEETEETEKTLEAPEEIPEKPEAEVEQPAEEEMAEEEAEEAEEILEEEAAEEEKLEIEKREEIEEEIVEERIYTIPLRRAWISPRKKRTPRAVRLVKAFIQRHMKPETLVMSNKVNERLWSRSIQKPPRKIRVRAVRDTEGKVTLYLAEGD
ncbi:MAG: 50S ribosomal protein L31e [Candidatus Bathyarchaeia archaeon]